MFEKDKHMSSNVYENVLDKLAARILDNILLDLVIASTSIN